MDNLIYYRNVILIYKFDSVFYTSVQIHIFNSVIISVKNIIISMDGNVLKIIVKL